MNTYNISVEIPVDTSIVSCENINKIRFEIYITEDTGDDICEKAAASLYTNNITPTYPTVWLCDDRDIVYLDVPMSTTSLSAVNLLHEFYIIRCNIEFNLRYCISDDDVAIEEIVPLSVKSVIDTT